MSDTSQFNLLLAGVDEAGRGPLAGPVSAAAVILDDVHDWSELNDSKKLSKKKRNELTTKIKKYALSWSIARATEKEIDKLNIHQATLLAMKRAVKELELRPNLIKVDGKFCPQGLKNCEAIIKGDSKVKAISAASILAKTWRDDYMVKLHQQYPEFQFSKHKGYPTKYHLEMIQHYGITEHHRTSFGPVTKYLMRTSKGNT